MKRSYLLLFALMIISFAALSQDSTSYTDYYGTYKLPEGNQVSEVGIIWRDSILNITSDMGDATMEKLGIDSFSMSYQDGIIKFNRDSFTNKVISLTIYISGVVIEGTREEPADKSSGFMNKYLKKEETV